MPTTIEMTPKQFHRFWLEKAAAFVAKQAKGGCFVECGVKQGTSSALMAKALGQPGFLFDTWQGFPHFSQEDFKSEHRRQRLKRRLKGKNTKQDCINTLKEHKIFSSCTMVQGDICKTVPRFSRNQLDLKISFMHVDTDLYEPAKVAFDYFAPKVIESGGIFVHDYGDKKWPGIRKVVDDFIASAQDFSIQVFPREDFYSCFLLRGDMEHFKDYYVGKIDVNKKW